MHDRSTDHLMPRMIADFGHQLNVVDRMSFGELTGRQCALVTSVSTFTTPPTLGQLAIREGSSHQNIKQMALKLQERGYVYLLPDGSDGRKVRVELTAKGELFCAEHRRRQNKFYELLHDGISEEELEHAAKVMEKFNDNLASVIEDGVVLEGQTA